MTNHKFRSSQDHQLGAAAVEFGLIAVIFFSILLGIVEFGRYMYLWNTLQEVTRKAAREAVVRNFNDKPDIQREAVFSQATSGDASVPLAWEITNVRVDIHYLNASRVDATPLPATPEANIIACEISQTANDCVRFIKVSLCDAQGGVCDPVRYTPLASLFTFLSFDIPVSSVVMPAESLGYRL